MILSVKDNSAIWYGPCHAGTTVVWGTTGVFVSGGSTQRLLAVVERLLVSLRSVEHTFAALNKFYIWFGGIGPFLVWLMFALDKFRGDFVRWQIFLLLWTPLSIWISCQNLVFTIWRIVSLDIHFRFYYLCFLSA
jgi:hypothetical protein